MCAYVSWNQIWGSSLWFSTVSQNCMKKKEQLMKNSSYWSFTLSWVLALTKGNIGKTQKGRKVTWQCWAQPLLHNQLALMRTMCTNLVWNWLDEKLSFFLLSVEMWLCVELSCEFCGYFIFIILQSVFTLPF